MKNVSKFIIASTLALAAAVPAIAGPLSAMKGNESDALIERNTYQYTLDGREIVRPSNQHAGAAQHAKDAFAADLTGYTVRNSAQVNIQ